MKLPLFLHQGKLKKIFFKKTQFHNSCLLKQSLGWRSACCISFLWLDEFERRESDQSFGGSGGEAEIYQVTKEEPRLGVCII